MLAALLPGVREFRTPFVTGLLWAASLAILFGPSLAQSEASRSFVERLEPLQIPGSAWLAAGSFLVYLVGSLLVVQRSPFARVEPRLRKKVQKWLKRRDQKAASSTRTTWNRRDSVSQRWQETLWEWSRDPDDRYNAVDRWLANDFDVIGTRRGVPVMYDFNGPCDAFSGFDCYYTSESVGQVEEVLHREGQAPDEGVYGKIQASYLRMVRSEQEQIETRIQLKFPEVYAEIDRLKVEGEFRLSIFWPLVFVILALSVTWSPWVLLVGVVLPPILRDAFNRIAEADMKTWTVVMAREVTSPVQDAMSEETEVREDFADRYGFSFIAHRDEQDQVAS